MQSADVVREEAVAALDSGTPEAAFATIVGTGLRPSFPGGHGGPGFLPTVSS